MTVQPGAPAGLGDREVEQSETTGDPQRATRGKSVAPARPASSPPDRDPLARGRNPEDAPGRGRDSSAAGGRRIGIEDLLLDVQRRLEVLYALEHEHAVTDFLIPEEAAGEFPGGGSRTLVTQEGEEIRLGVVLDGSVGERLRRADPRVRLSAENLGPFCTVTEEVSHCVYLLFCARSSRTVTQLELELQAEVDKYLCAAFLLSLQNEGAVSARLRELLFRRYRLAEDLSPERAERYRTASKLAYRYCGYLESRFLRPSRLADLAREARRFYRLGQREKLERIADVG